VLHAPLAHSLAVRRRPGVHTPAGVFQYREHALLYAAALTVSARDSNLTVGQTRDDAGLVVGEFSAAGGLKTVGHVQVFDQDAAASLRVLEALLRNPDAFGSIVDAGGVTLAELVGDLLAAEYLAGKDGSQNGAGRHSRGRGCEPRP